MGFSSDLDFQSLLSPKLNGQAPIEADAEENTPFPIATPQNLKEFVASRNKPEMSILIEEYEKNPLKIKNKYYLEYWSDTAAFKCALSVLLCDDYLTYSSLPSVRQETKRFFAIAARLPLELQMVLMHRCEGSPLNILLSKALEVEFKKICTLYSGF